MKGPRIPANSPSLRSWIEVSADSDFPIQNIPFGIFSTEVRSPRPCTRIGDVVVDLQVLAEAELLNDLGIDPAVFHVPKLNPLIKHGKLALRELRQRISDLFKEENNFLRERTDTVKDALLPVNEVAMHLPVEVGDYTDFYSSREHAFNVGTMFRGPENALMPNWVHLPVGYHGRASSIVVSGTAIHRPKGQMRPDADAPPIFGPSKQLDFELETGFITFSGNALGRSIPIADAEDHIFGMVLFNDWSARDIQSWEYVPLGPFLGKNFGSSMSAWVVTLDALEPFRVPAPDQDPEPLPYLSLPGDHSFDIALEVALIPEGAKESVIARSNFKYLYWTMAQQLAHHSVNGCNIRAGDLMASGTISGPTPDSYGSMLELSWRGTRPIALAEGGERKFILDGDVVVMRGHAERRMEDGSTTRIGFGEVRGRILPAH